MTDWARTWARRERQRVIYDAPTIRSHAPLFSDYARILFPASGGGLSPMPWSSALERTITPETRWDEGVARSRNLGTTAGDLPLGVALSLVEALRAHEDSVSFGYWEGYGDVERQQVAFEAVLPPDDRALWFVRGLGAEVVSLTGRVGRGPMRWYPDHQRWAVTGDIYDRSVIVSGASDVVDAILARPDLEAVRVPPSLARSVMV